MYGRLSKTVIYCFGWCGGRWNGISTPLGMSIDVADANAIAKGIVPHAKSSSFTVTCMIG
jgi:hypothetical protein